MYGDYKARFTSQVGLLLSRCIRNLRMTPFDSSACVPFNSLLWDHDGSLWVHARSTNFKGAHLNWEAAKQIQEPGDF